MKNTYRGIFFEGEYDRPFFLSVVPPSGRRPWPITTEADRDYVEGKPVTVEFAYPVHYVPAGKRSTGASWVRDCAAVLLKTAGASKLPTACVIRRDDGDITEVVQFESELWWSLPGRPTVERFVAALAAGEPAAVGLLDQGCVTTRKAASSESDLAIKRLVWNGRDNRLARLGRGAQGLLVADGTVFVRDGAPLLALWNGYRNQSITSVGISPVIIELASSRRNPAFDDVSNELIFGRPFEACDLSGVELFAVEKAVGIGEDASIEIMLPDLLRQDPVTVQLEATLGKLARLLAIRRPGAEHGSKDIALQLARLRRTTEEAGSAADRARALKGFADWVVGPEEWKKKFRVERLFVRDAIDRVEAECDRRKLSSPFAESHLSEEDEAAVDRHFGSSL